jgi:hypothetical protein
MSTNSQRKLYDLFANNGGCELPCFLGITPATTSWQDAKVLFEEFARNAPLTPNPFAVSSIHTEYIANVFTNSEVTLRGHIQTNVDVNDLVQQMVFQVEITRDGRTESRDKHLVWFSIRGIFNRYGQPDSIFLYSTESDLGYSIYIVYEKLKLAVAYTGESTLNEDDSRTLCPNVGDGNISYMKIAVASPADPVNIKTLIGYPFWEGIAVFEDVSGMSENDFYHLVISDQPVICFQTKPL